MKAARLLTDERRGAAFLESMGLRNSLLTDLREAATRGAYLHDVGKANHQFQRLVLRRSRLPQAFRHELLSLLLALKWEPLLGFSDREGAEEIVYASLFAASGHHLKLDGLELSPREGSGDGKLVLYTGHPDMKELLEQGRSLFGLPISRLDSANLQVKLAGDPMKEVREWVRQSMLWWEGSESETRRFVALVKALVVGADLIASAVARHQDAQRWVESVLGRVCRREELLAVAQKALKENPARAFQERVANASSRVAFVHAGCGTGKTVAAYLWAANKAHDRKIFFCYPTTGTATQGYADYVADESIIHSRLIHGRAEADLEMLRESEGDEIDVLDPVLRYQALSAWDAPMLVATADTVLGLIQNNRRGLFSFPAIGEGAFVFDEIHSYDERLFRALLRFLDAFLGCRTLLMTASLQRDRLRRIMDVLAGHGETMEVFHGPEEIESATRYLVNPVSKDAPWEEVRKTLRDGGKVLFVCNTVERARQVWREAGQRLDAPPSLLYHSRYRYVDRMQRHRSVTDAFSRENAGKPVLAVTTQVCEVSLDISADLLVTDLAPVPALIQRMGRVNRWSAGGTPGAVHITEVESPLPYPEEEMVVARRWLGELIEERGQFLSQADLARKFESYGSEVTTTRLDSSWLDGGPFSHPAPLREEGYTISVIRGEDRSKCVVGGGRRVLNKEVVKHSIPMALWPVVNEIKGWERLNGAFVAPSGKIEYSEEEGGSWR